MVTGQGVRIEVAAGLPDGSLGTDAVAIQQAIERADGPGGVVVLMDLGSAVLSAELALELLDDDGLRDRVLLSPAPIVEGLVVATVAAAGGATRSEVATEAAGALLAKSSQLDGGDVSPAPSGEPLPQPDRSARRAAPEVVGTFTVGNSHGLHARPAARLVAEVRGLDATVLLTNLTTGAGPAPASSMSRVGALGALRGHQVEVRASGEQAQSAVDRVVALAARQFDETAADQTAADQTAAETRPGSAQSSGSQPAAPGLAVGPARHLVVPDVDIDADTDAQPDQRAPDRADERGRLDAAIGLVRQEIQALSRAAGGVETAGIFAAHLALLDDDEVLDDVRRRIDEGVPAARAWDQSMSAVAQTWAALPDAYLRARAEDVHGVRQQVLRALIGAPEARMSGPGILVAQDITPAETVRLELALVQGIVLAEGSPTSHAAILARARAIPLVVGAGREVLEVADGTPIALDGGSGELHINPSAETIESFGARRSDRSRRQTDELAAASEPARTTDGVDVVVAANLGSVEEAIVGARAGAAGSGLVRTEFLFLGRSTPPSRAEQIDAYTAIAHAMTGQRITLRTLDIGGDKPASYVDGPAEDNPFLGVRGLRLSLRHRDLFVDQLAAVCAVARRHPVSLMFPMVSVVPELMAARELLVEAAGSDGVPTDLKVGMMVEVPAAALKLASFAPYLDFVSIGTNDLTQYAMAAERGNAGVAELSDSLDPGVLQLVDAVCRAAEGRIEVAVCGESAADDLAIPVLLGLGVRELSVAPPAVPHTKALVRALDSTTCRAIAAASLTAATAAEVRELVRGELPGLLGG